jgi:hypothetical protein
MSEANSFWSLIILEPNPFGTESFWSPIHLEPIPFGAQSLLLLNHCGTQIIMEAQSLMDPNSFGAQSLFDINPQERSTLE